MIVLRWYPETAHRELEDLNPEDAAPPPSPDRGSDGVSRRRARGTSIAPVAERPSTEKEDPTWAMALAAY